MVAIIMLKMESKDIQHKNIDEEEVALASVG